MLALQQITSYLDDYLAIRDITDDSWNGLQFQGADRITKIAAAVDATAESITQAAAMKANFLLVHHGHFWLQANPSLRGWQQQRLLALAQHDISLYAAHLPLDKHTVVGNNAQLLQLINAKLTGDFYPHHGVNIGLLGRLPPTSLSAVDECLKTKLNTTSRLLPYGKQTIETVAVCSGGGSYAGFFAALEAGVDLYISGDPVYVDPTAKEAKINVLFAGHYATETVGVKALAQHLSVKYSLPYSFIDLPPLV